MKFELTTDRLLLKVLTYEDAKKVLEFYNKNGKVFEKYEPIIGEDFYTLEHQKNILNFEYKNILKLSMLRYWIFDKNDTSKIIGTVSFRNIMRPIYSCCTVGYKMDTDFHNMGYCTEALKALIPIVQTELGIHRIEAYVLPDNGPSIHMLEKLGFEKEGLIRDKIMINNQRFDHYLYSLLGNN